jgi:hypothetical protein
MLGEVNPKKTTYIPVKIKVDICGIKYNTIFLKRI